MICGDFNDTPWSYTYHTVIDNLEDSFVESGFGLSNTYNGKLPSFRIDYILHSKQYTSYNYKRDRVPYSDHFPISCYLELSGK
jgi:endonuclease/exonuclease/phosphatase family metal-dependent hydrolase